MVRASLKAEHFILDCLAVIVAMLLVPWAMMHFALVSVESDSGDLDEYSSSR